MKTGAEAFAGAVIFIFALCVGVAAVGFFVAGGVINVIVGVFLAIGCFSLIRLGERGMGAPERER